MSHSSGKYLHHNLNIKRLYELYNKECSNGARKVVSLSYFSKIFKARFDLEFAKPKKMRCNKCEAIGKSLKNVLSPVSSKRNYFNKKKQAFATGKKDK